MATTRAVSSLILLAISTSLLLLPYWSTGAQLCPFDQIYQLGDSISDTGNLIRESLLGALITPFSRLPYGETLKSATGRCSDGLLMIDYIAMAAGLPLLNPYKKMNAHFSHGVNFAVAGATALSTDYLLHNRILSPLTLSSLSVQLDWMSIYFSSFCHNQTDCAKKFNNSLFIVGEIGGNDLNYALIEGKGVVEAKSLVPVVVQAIKEAVTRVIGFGASRVVVPGNFPIGCFPIYLTEFQADNRAAYDEFNCLKELNNLSVSLNIEIQCAIEDLKNMFPSAIIVYGDYYNAFNYVYQNAGTLGFDIMSKRKACCGTGGDYNFSLLWMCGFPGSTTCPNPAQYISWDGVHMTQAAYKIMAEWLICDISPKLQCPV